MNLADRKIVTPKGMVLRDYQVAGVRHLMSGQKKILSDDMGLGKTAQTIVAFNSLNARNVLIICPATVVNQWAREIKAWSYRDYIVVTLKTGKDWLPDANVVILSYNLLYSKMTHDQLRKKKWGVFVLDEIHYCGNYKSQRTKLTLGHHKGIVNNSVFTWGLSGTPMTNTPVNLYAICRAMGPKYWNRKFNWMWFTQRYCQRYKDGFGWNVSGACRLDELKEKLFDTGFMLRRTKAEVLDELPPMQYRLAMVDSKSKLMKRRADWDETVKQIDFSRSGLGVDASQLAEIRREIGELKIPAIIEYVEEALLTEEKIIVFTWHKVVTLTIEQMFNAKGIESVAYYGDMNAKTKARSIHNFVNGEARLFVANVASAGTGLDGLQKACSYCVFAEIPWSYVAIDQAASRLHRMGQKGNVLADLLVAENTVEEYVMRQIVRKKSIYSKLLLTDG